MIKNVLFSLLGALVFVLPGAAANRPNVVVIFADDLAIRAGDWLFIGGRDGKATRLLK